MRARSTDISGILIIAVAVVLSSCGGTPESAHTTTPAAGERATPAKASAPVGPSWNEYLDDLAPNLETGATGLGIDPKFWDKWDGKLIEWNGKLSSCARSAKGEVRCDVAMPPRTVKVKGGPAVGMPISIVSVSPELADAERWQGLAPGSAVTFRAKTLSTVMVMPNRKAGKDQVLVGILLNDARLISSK